MINFYAGADMPSNEKPNPIVTEFFTRYRKLNIFLAFITQYFFAAPRNIKLNSTHVFIINIPEKREHQEIAFSHSSDIDFRYFMNPYKKCTANPYILLVIDATLGSENPLGFRENLLERI